MKDKIEMELKPFETMCDTTTEHLKQMINGAEAANPEEILTVAKVLGAIIDIKKDVVEICYKKQIMEAMEESDFEEYRGKMSYSEPYKRGKMMPDDDFYRQRDMDYPRKMYYTDGGSSNGGNNSNRGSNNGNNSSGGSRMGKDSREGMSGEMRRTYVESKQMHGSDSDEMETLEEFLNTLDSDMMQLYPNMTPAERQMTKNKLSAMMQKVKI